MTRIRHHIALVLTALVLTSAAVTTLPLTATTPTAHADGGEALAGTPRGAADRIAAGDRHTCAISSSGATVGAVFCWGNNTLGQLGIGDVDNRGDAPGEIGSALKPVALGRPAVSISAGTAHTCAVLDDGNVKCWGYNSSGQLGQGDTLTRGDGAGDMDPAFTPPVDLGPGRTAVMVTAGVEFSCALLDDGSVKCWGDNAAGQLGLGDTNDRGDGPGEMGATLPAVDLGDGRTAIAITAGGAHACAILDTHEVKCWGNNDAGQLGLGDLSNRGDQPGELGDALPVVDLGAGVHARALASGRFHTCAVVSGTAVKCWGDNQFGQLGLGDTNGRGDEPGEMGDALPVVAHDPDNELIGVTAMSFGTCVFQNGQVPRCWGANGAGQLALGSTTTQLSPSFSQTGAATAMTGGDGHLCWSDVAGAIRCAGANDSGQLGQGDTLRRGDAPWVGQLPAVPLRGVDVPLQVAAGYNHTCFLVAGGGVRCMGNNFAGQLGLGDTTNRGKTTSSIGDNVPLVDLGTGRTAVKVAAGEFVTCAILDNGAVKCWGLNDKGQLGLGDTNNRGDVAGEMGDNLPAVALGTGRTAVDVTIGHFHTCALLDNGSVKCWGESTWGQLGLEAPGTWGDQPGEMGDALPAVQLGTGRIATQVVAGYGTTCALLDDQQLKCWGYGGWGVTGDGTGSIRGLSQGDMGDAMPAIDLGTGRHAVQFGVNTAACALLDDGTVKCWGANPFGVGGQGDTAVRGDQPGEMGDALPTVPLGTGRHAASIAVGYEFACAVLDDGSVKCWGANGNGQLGLDDTQPRGDAQGEMGDALPALALPAAAASIDALDHAACATLVDGRVKCWGANQSGQLAAGIGAGSVGAFGGTFTTGALSDPGSVEVKVLPAAVRPGVPTSVSATPGTLTATVTWSAPPSDGGAAVTGYRIEQSTDGVHWAAAVTDTGTTATTATLSGLTPGVNHRFRVAARNARGTGPASLPSADVVPVSVPGAPTALVAVPGDGQVSLSWVPGASNGLKVLGYKVQRSVDGGATWSSIDTGSNVPSLVVSGLTNFAPVRFRVSATNLAGTGAVSAPTADVVPTTSSYWPVQSFRLVDTRSGRSTGDGMGAGGGAVKAKGTLAVKVAGRGGVPTDAKSVSVTVSVLKPNAAGSLSLWPCGAARSRATTLDFTAGATVTNTAVVKVGTNGTICAYSTATTHLTVDVTGAHPATNLYMPVNPARLADTRVGGRTSDGKGAGTGTLKAGGVLVVKVGGRAGVTTAAKVAVVNVTAVSPAANAKVTVYPCGTTRPGVPTMYAKAGSRTSNMAVVRLGTSSAVCVHSTAATDLLVDVSGSSPAAGTLVALTPKRLATGATRTAATTVLRVAVAGRNGVPVGATSAVLDITVTNAAAAGSVVVFDCGTKPLATNQSFTSGSTVSLTVLAKLGADGAVCIYTSAKASIVVDVHGHQ